MGLGPARGRGPGYPGGRRADGRDRSTSRRGVAPGGPAARVERFLETEPIIWLSTIRPDGAPHLVPTWFAWDGDMIVILSKPGARKVRNLRADRRAMLALGNAEDEFDVGLLEATADLVAIPTPLELPAGFLAKYGSRIAGLGLTPAQFAWTYSQVIRLTPRKALGWHGRTQPASVVTAARRVAVAGSPSIAEPGRRLLDRLGEPLAVVLPPGLVPHGLSI